MGLHDIEKILHGKGYCHSDKANAEKVPLRSGQGVERGGQNKQIKQKSMYEIITIKLIILYTNP